MDEVLEANTDVTEKELIDLCEEMDVMPSQALKILRREQKAGAKPKPKLPRSSRGSGELADEKKDEKAAPRTLDDINRFIKAGLKKGLF